MRLPRRARALSVPLRLRFDGTLRTAVCRSTSANSPRRAAAAAQGPEPNLRQPCNRVNAGLPPAPRLCRGPCSNAQEVRCLMFRPRALPTHRRRCPAARARRLPSAASAALSLTHLNRLIGEGRFPRFAALGLRTSELTEHQLDAFFAERLSARVVRPLLPRGAVRPRAGACAARHPTTTMPVHAAPTSPPHPTPRTLREGCAIVVDASPHRAACAAYGTGAGTHRRGGDAHENTHSGCLRSAQVRQSAASPVLRYAPMRPQHDTGVRR